MKKTALFFIGLLVLLIGALPATVLLTDDFTGSGLLTANGWIQTGTTTTTPMSIASPGLTYTGYLSSGIGDATTPTANGQDVYKAFTSTTSGSIYYSFMINTAITATTAGYQVHLGNTVGTTSAFSARFWIVASGGNVNFGISKANNTPIYAPTSYALNTTHLVIIKYTFNTGSTTDDVMDMWVNPTLGSTEPTPTVSITEASTDPTSLAEICIRQYNTASLARLDGFRVGTSWVDVGDLAGGTPTCAVPVISPGAGYQYSTFDATITCDTPGAVIYYTLDGTDPNEDTSTEYSGPISISSTTTLKAIAYATGYDPSTIATSIFTFPITVNSIADLRAGTVGGPLYYLSSEAILTFQTATQMFIQDASAAIVVYDASNIITTNYNLYDGITGIYGTLALYNGLLEFIPTQNAAAATTTGNTVVPEERTLESLTSADQCKLVKIINVSLDATAGTFTSTAQNIAATQDVTTLTMRTFAAADYSGTPIPVVPQNITALVGQFNSAIQFSPRFLADFEDYELPLPVVLTSFFAVPTAENYVALHWTTQSETNVSGYYIYRGSNGDLASALRIPSMITATNTSTQSNYVFTDEEVVVGNSYYYWLQNLDLSGASDFHGPISITLTNHNSTTPPPIPQVTQLLDAYPNPFNPETRLNYSIKAAGDVNISVYNSKGQLIRSFDRTHDSAKSDFFTWDGKDLNGRQVASGIYFYRMNSGKYTSGKKVVLLK